MKEMILRIRNGVQILARRVEVDGAVLDAGGVPVVGVATLVVGILLVVLGGQATVIQVVVVGAAELGSRLQVIVVGVVLTQVKVVGVARVEPVVAAGAEVVVAPVAVVGLLPSMILSKNPVVGVVAV